jgi:hypothetical protein
MSADWLANGAHTMRHGWHVAMVVGAPVAVFLMTIAFIERVAEGGDHRGAVLLKVIASGVVVAAAAAADIITVSGAVLAIGFVLAALVAYAVTLQHRLHRRSAH